MKTTLSPPRATTLLDTTLRALVVLVAALPVAGVSAADPTASAGSALPATLPAALPSALPADVTGNADASPRAGWSGIPLETLGDDHRVREGHVGPAEDAARDADAAAAGIVVGATPADDALSRSGFRQSLTWVADVDVLLRDDGDGDGYFGTLDLTIDVDTESVQQEVYAVIELTEPDGTLTLRHATNAFTIFGNASSDRYRVEIELLESHRAVERDAYIEIRDSWTDVRLDSVSAFELASLAALPLGSGRPGFPIRDDGRRPVGSSGFVLGVASSGSTNGSGVGVAFGTQTVAAGYAGAAGPLGALSLLGAVLFRRRASARRS